MKLEDVRRAIETEWMALPAEDHKTDNQAVAFAMRAAQRHMVPLKSDPYETVKGWLSAYVGLL